ncbi:Protein numb -like protein [Takifugu flavidus]|uniref:Protein numb-like protein n=1 Tax=Takifugu flavidus TaxID=433684 RepID=A0A5C6P0V5_9TELE|nr:Protein numb -like protein [Takifugu flavidus]
MNKLRQSFRRKKDIYVPESSRPHQWQTDEEAVRSGKCSFGVKKPVRDDLSLGTRAASSWRQHQKVLHCGHDGMEVASTKTQGVCSL